MKILEFTELAIKLRNATVKRFHAMQKSDKLAVDLALDGRMDNILGSLLQSLH
jgi:hypothetical protein